MSIRSAPPAEDIGVHGHGHGHKSSHHGSMMAHHGRQLMHHGGQAARDAAHHATRSVTHHATKVGRHIWAGLTALGTKAASHAKGLAGHAMEHAKTFTEHVARAHNEVASALAEKAKGSLGSSIHARVPKHVLRPNSEVQQHIHFHITTTAADKGLLAVGASANAINHTATSAAQGQVVDHALHAMGGEISHHGDLRDIVHKVHAFVHGGGPPHLSHHREAVVHAQTAASMCGTAAAGAAHIENSEHHA